MSRTENVELTVLCLIEDGDKILLQNRVNWDLWRNNAMKKAITILITALWKSITEQEGLHEQERN